MSFTTDIQTIAKTRILEEKVGKALNLAEIANEEVKANLLGERVTANQDMTVQTPSNPPPITGVGSGGVLPIAPEPAPASILPPISQGTTTTPVANPGPQSGSDNQSNVGGGGGGSSSSTTPTNLAGNATGGGTPGVDGGAGGSPVGGSYINQIATIIGTDSVAAALNTQMISEGVSEQARLATLSTYMSAKYGEPGVVTASQIANNTSSNPQLDSSATSPGTAIQQSQYPGSSLSDNVLKGIIGFNSDSYISPITGTLQSVLVRLDGLYPIPLNFDSEAAGQYQAWTDANSPPAFIGWQVNKIWSVFSAVIAAASTAEGAMTTWAAHTLGLGLFNPTYTNLQVASTSSGIPLTYTFDYSYYDAPNFGGTHFTGTNTVLRFASSLNPSVASATQPFYDWPQTGSYVVSLQGSLFKSSPLDTEAPFALANTDTSEILLAIGDGVNVSDDRYMKASLGINGGIILTILANDKTTVQFANYYDANRSLVAPNLPPSSIPFYIPH